MPDDFDARAKKIISLVQDELNLISTGRARPSMIEGLSVEAYPGQHMKLLELASISAPDAQLLVVTPWDKSVSDAILKAIHNSGLNLSPTDDGEHIKIRIPSLTEESRLELVKLVSQKIESGKNMLRDARIKAKKSIESQDGEDGISEDDIRSWLDDLQKRFNQFVEQIEEMGSKKEKEVTSI